MRATCRGGPDHTVTPPSAVSPPDSRCSLGRREPARVVVSGRSAAGRPPPEGLALPRPSEEPPHVSDPRGPAFLGHRPLAGPRVLGRRRPGRADRRVYHGRRALGRRVRARNHTLLHRAAAPQRPGCGGRLQRCRVRDRPVHRAPPLRARARHHQYLVSGRSLLPDPGAGARQPRADRCPRKVLAHWANILRRSRRHPIRGSPYASSRPGRTGTALGAVHC